MAGGIAAREPRTRGVRAEQHGGHQSIANTELEGGSTARQLLQAHGRAGDATYSQMIADTERDFSGAVGVGHGPVDASTGLGVSEPRNELYAREKRGHAPCARRSKAAAETQHFLPIRFD